MSTTAVRKVFLASLLGRRLATGLSLFAITLGVALGLAVQLIHGAALDEFGRGMRLLAGEADLQVLGPRAGFDDDVYITLAQRAEVAQASPVVEVEAQLPGRDTTLRIYAIDIFRAAQVMPALMPASATETGEPREEGEPGEEGEGAAAERDSGEDEVRGGQFAALQPDRVFLSAAARAAFGLAAGDTLTVQTGLREHTLRIAGAVPGAAAGQVFGVMDIAAAQQLFDRMGRLTRVDVRLAPGVDREVGRQALGAIVPAGVVVLAPEAVASQTSGLSRAYRVNLTMLAVIALLTGAFLVFSTQLLSVVKRRQEFAFLRALGLQQKALLNGLLAEGAVIGLVGGVFGVALGYGLTALAFALIGGDLGAGYFAGVAPTVKILPLASLAYLALGVAAGIGGAWLPAREALRMTPARALRAGDEIEVLQARQHRWPAAFACFALAAGFCLPGPIAGIPVFGYAAVALILAGAVLTLPGATRMAMRTLNGVGSVVGRLAHARLEAAPGQVVVAGAGVVTSVALAVSMAIMVSSFRGSVDDWLAQVLPADLYLRASTSSASGFIDPDTIARISQLPGVAAVQSVRYESVRMSDERFPMTLIARAVADGTPPPLVAGEVSTGDANGDADGVAPAWITEAMSDLLVLKVGDTLALPLAGQVHTFRVAGIWRDYARQHGAVLIESDLYRRITGDERSNDVWIHLAADVDVTTVINTLRDMLGEQTVEIAQTAEIRAISLEIFDRTFLVTYLMQGVAIVIGLFGIGTTFAALATRRRKEFGMLRHLGLRCHEVGRLLALEGGLSAAVGVGVGMVAGAAIAFVLVEVINRQSFHWSMDMSLPLGGLALFAAVLVALASLAARLSGYQAMRRGAVAAVREDW